METISRSQEERKEDGLLSREEMVKKYLYLVKSIAMRFAMRIPPSVSYDELVSAGNLGLIDAVNKFEPERHVNFNTYAKFRIKGAILDELRNLDNYSRSLRQKMQSIEKAVQKIEKEENRAAEEDEVADELGVTMEEYQDMLKDVHSIAFFSLDSTIRNSFKPSSSSRTTFQDQLKGDDNPEKRLDEVELKKAVAGAIDSLNEKEKLVITLYYYEELTLKEIGEIFERTESRICQIHSAALIKLKSRVQDLI